MADRSPSDRKSNTTSTNTAWENQDQMKERNLSLENSKESDGRLLNRPATSPGLVYAGWQSTASYMAQLEQVCDEVS